MLGQFQKVSVYASRITPEVPFVLLFLSIIAGVISGALYASDTIANVGLALFFLTFAIILGIFGLLWLWPFGALNRLHKLSEDEPSPFFYPLFCWIVICSIFSAGFGLPIVFYYELNPEPLLGILWIGISFSLLGIRILFVLTLRKIENKLRLRTHSLGWTMIAALFLIIGIIPLSDRLNKVEEASNKNNSTS